MPDRMTPDQRHECMASIHSKDTRPEQTVRRELWHRGYRFRKCVRTLPGTPDIVLPKYRTCIFVNGCFWHGHSDCKYYQTPKSNQDYWIPKIRRNQERDKAVQQQLAQMGWHCITIWECQLKPKRRQATLAGLAYTLNKIFLDDRKPKPYSIEDSETRMAAEAKEEYIERQAHK